MGCRRGADTSPEDIVTIFCLSDVFLFPSEEESFGLAALEAMACEVPVIASRSGGIQEVIKNNQGGFLCKIGDIEGMAKLAIKLGTFPELRKKIGKAGRNRADKKFSPEVILPQYEHIYLDAIKKCRKQTSRSSPNKPVK